MLKPFEQQPFSTLPELPRREHPYVGLEPRFVTVPSSHFGDVDVHYRELGSGPPLLLIHGLMTTSYSWRYVLAPLAERFRVIAPDLVGCGRSDKPDVRYGAREVAAFVGDLQRTMDIRGGDVVGNSMGGYLCMQLAQLDGGAMRRLVNIHSPGVPMMRLFALRGAMAVPGSERLLRRLIRVDPERWVHRNVHYWDETLKSLEEAREYAAPLRTRDGSRAFARYLSDTLCPFEMRRFVRRMDAQTFPVPLALIYSRRDPMVPPSVGEELRRLTGGDLTWLDACSHFAHVDKPEALAEAIVSFFD